jgi:hypothetical protein
MDQRSFYTLKQENPLFPILTLRTGGYITQQKPSENKPSNSYFYNPYKTKSSALNELGALNYSVLFS